MAITKTCIVEGCERPAGDNHPVYCPAHAYRLRAWGDVRADIPIADRRPQGLTAACEVEGCDRPHFSKGLCNPHYQRLRLKGDVLADTPIRERAS